MTLMPLRDFVVSEFLAKPTKGALPSSGGESTNHLERFRKLERCAEAGDLVAWKKNKEAAQEAGLDLAKDLETQVRVKQMELTLYMRATKFAHQNATNTEKRALEAQISNQGDQARQLFQRAQKFSDLASHLTQHLKAKTA